MGRIRGKRNRDSDRYWHERRKAEQFGMVGMAPAFTRGDDSSSANQLARCPWCRGVRLLRHGSRVDGRGRVPRWMCAACYRTFSDGLSGAAGNHTSPEGVKAIQAAFSSGCGIRAAARESGIARPTIRRLIALGVVRPGRCGCGEAATHQGWCSYRFARSTSRQAFMASWEPVRLGGPRVLLRWPYSGREDELLRLIDAHAPKEWPEQVRADICQETAILLLDGTYASDQIREALADGRRRVYALFPTHYGAPKSLSSPIYDEGDEAMANRLVSWMPSFTLGDIVRDRNHGVCPIMVDREAHVEMDPEIMAVMQSDAHPKWFRPMNNL